jgi:protein-tyrosine phosphatase
MTILFLCSGNTCRSPMALAAWRSLERSDEKPFGEQVCVRSAGLAVPPPALSDSKGRKKRGAPASRHAQKVAHAWGEDLSTHSAQGLSSQLLDEAALILTMTDDQALAVRDYFGFKAYNVRPLGEFISSESFAVSEDQRLAALLGQVTRATRTARDIVDPYGGSFEAYHSCGEEIRNALIGLRRALRAGELSHAGETL